MIPPYTHKERYQRSLEATRRYRERNKEKVRAKQAEWRAKNQDKIRAIRLAYRSKEENKKKERDYNKRWSELNPDKKKAQQKRCYYKNWDKRKAYRIENADRLSKKSQEWNRSNSEKFNANMRSYRKRNPGKCIERTGRYRAKVAGNTAGDPKKITEWIKAWRSGESVTCYWCQGEFTPDKCESDHVVPISRGGKHCLSNLVISCRKCNRSKSGKLHHEWDATASGHSQTGWLPQS